MSHHATWSTLSAVVTVAALSAPAPAQPVAFTVHAIYPAGDQAYDIAAGDVNRDGIIDLVVCNANVDTVLVFRGNGDATFTLHTSINLAPAGGDRPLGVAVGDVNGDTWPDIVTANITSDNMTLVMNDGAGAFPAPGVSFPMGNAALSIRLADLNGDGRLDVVTANQSDDNVSIRFGTGAPGAGAFGALTTYPAGDGPNDVSAGDLNADGYPDLVVADFFGDTIAVLFNRCDGTFRAPVFYTGPDAPTSVAIGEMSGPPALDVGVVDINTRALRIYTNDGAGALANPGAGLPVGQSPQGLVIGDFDYDGLPDVAVANCLSDSITIYAGGLDAPVTLNAIGDCPQGIVASDFNADGLIDLATCNFAGDNISILVNTSTVQPPSAPTLASPANNAVGVATNPTLVWTPFPIGRASFTVKVALDSAFSNLVLEQSAGESPFLEVAMGALSDNQRYYWTVTAVNPAGQAGAAPPPGWFTFATPRTGDLNADGIVNALDLALLLGNWGGP